jgi:hypothetical protein
MKRYIVLLSLVLASCSTIKIEEQIVQDFVKEKDLKKIPYLGASYLIEEAASNKNVLDYYEMAYLDRNLSIDKKRIDFIPKIFNWPIDIIEIKSLKLINRKDSLSYQWESKNFKTLEIPIMKRKELLSKVDKEILSISTIGHILSKPVLSLNKKYALIKYSTIFFTGGNSGLIYLLKKEKGKWVIKEEFYNPNVMD